MTSPDSSSKTVKIVLIVLGSIVGCFILGFIVLAIIGAILVSTDDESTPTANPAPSAEQRDVATDSPVTAAGSTVKTACYTYEIPKEYELVKGSEMCHSAVNFPGGDVLTSVEVGATSDTLSAEAAIAKMKATMPDKLTFIDSAITQRGDLRFGVIRFKDSNGLPRAYYYIPDPRPHLRIGGKLVSSYSIVTYVHNNRLRAKAETVLDSFKLTD